MPPALTQTGEHFSLRTLESGLTDFMPPAGSFDPAASWTNVYTVYTLTLGVFTTGTLTIARAPRPGGGSILTITMVKNTPTSAVQRYEGVIEMAGIGLGKPLSWSLHARTQQGGSVQPGTEVNVTGSLDGANQMTIVSAGVTRTVDLPAGPVASNWGLMEAVQRLPGVAFPVANFTLVDHYDEPKEAQRLAHRKEAFVAIGGTETIVRDAEPLEKGTRYIPRLVREGGSETEFDVYEQTGEGIIPIVYWVQKGGRLLFVSSGIEGYILDSAASS